MRSKYPILITLTIPAILLVTWMAVSLFSGVKTIILPPPWHVGEKLVAAVSSKGLWQDLGLTLFRTGVGYLFGVTTGVLLGAAMGSWKRVHDMMIMPVDALRSLPATTLLPLFMLALGWGTKSLVMLVAFPTCWLVTINTMYGVRNTSLIRKEMAQMFQLDSTKIFFFVTLPDALPSIAASLRLSVAISLHMAIIGEMIMGTSSGLGYRIFNDHMLLRVPEMYATIIIVGLLGYLLNFVFTRLEGRIFFWGSWDKQ